MRRRTAGLFLLLLAAASAPAAAQPARESDARQGLSKLEQDMAAAQKRKTELDARAAAQAEELAQLRDKLVSAGQATRENEASLSGFEERFAVLEGEAAAKRQALAMKGDHLTALLMALQRLALDPPVALATLPEPPLDTVRGALIMGGTVPAIAAQAKELKLELAALSDADEAVRRQRALIEDASGRLSAERRDLDGLIQRKAALEQRTEAERRLEADRLTKLAGAAKTLRELIQRLEAQRQAEERTRLAEERSRARAEPIASRSATGGASVTPASRPGARTVPASGKLMASYGQTDEYGAVTRGLTIETRPDAVVVAPDSGRVLFSGPFRGYGLILIIEHGGGYHSLLAGLGRIDASVGRTVEAGEPVGTMGHEPDHTPSLYFELRRSGQPTNPQPWLIAQGGK
jgi:septal ring factor EnvC (AmiA/AmiB activator)